MKARYNNGLRNLALCSLFITSYIPLFAIVILKQLNDGWAYLYWGGYNREAIGCFLKHFGMSASATQSAPFAEAYRELCFLE